jgi:hypothetical protein
MLPCGAEAHASREGEGVRGAHKSQIAVAERFGRPGGVLGTGPIRCMLLFIRCPYTWLSED